MGADFPKQLRSTKVLLSNYPRHETKKKQSRNYHKGNETHGILRLKPHMQNPNNNFLDNLATVSVALIYSRKKMIKKIHKMAFLLQDTVSVKHSLKKNTENIL